MTSANLTCVNRNCDLMNCLKYLLSCSLPAVLPVIPQMSVVRVAVACQGPRQLAERAAALASLLSSSAAGSRVVVALVPPLRPLLTSATVGEWSGALAALYTEARALDLTLTLGEGSGGEVVDLSTLPASPYTPIPPRSTDRLYQEVHPLPSPPCRWCWAAPLTGSTPATASSSPPRSSGAPAGSPWGSPAPHSSPSRWA